MYTERVGDRESASESQRIRESERERERERKRYIYMCCGVIIWAKFGLLRCYYLGQVCFLQNTACQKTL